MDVVSGFLRPLHIVAASAWFGSALIFHGFIEPAAARVGPNADRFFLNFLSGPFRTAISLAAVVTIGAGMAMYWIDARGFGTAWIFSPAGLSYAGGALAALAALAIALTVTGPNTLKLGTLERKFGASNWNLDAADSRQLERTRKRLRDGGRVGTLLLLAALLAMTIARAL